MNGMKLMWDSDARTQSSYSFIFLNILPLLSSPLCVLGKLCIEHHKASNTTELLKHSTCPLYFQLAYYLYFFSWGHKLFEPPQGKFLAWEHNNMEKNPGTHKLINWDIRALLNFLHPLTKEFPLLLFSKLIFLQFIWDYVTWLNNGPEEENNAYMSDAYLQEALSQVANPSSHILIYWNCYIWEWWDLYY